MSIYSPSGRFIAVSSGMMNLRDSQDEEYVCKRLSNMYEV